MAEPLSRACLDYVADLLRWDAQVARLERAAGLSVSTWLSGVLLAPDGRLWVGTGCRGTKGVGRSAPSDPEAVAADPVAAWRYARLGHQERRAADAVLADGQGERLVAVVAGTRSVECSLAARIGLALVELPQATRWYRKIAEGDSIPAVRGAEAVGTPRLERAAEAWWAAVGEAARGR